MIIVLEAAMIIVLFLTYFMTARITASIAADHGGNYSDWFWDTFIWFLIPTFKLYGTYKLTDEQKRAINIPLYLTIMFFGLAILTEIVRQ